METIGELSNVCSQNALKYLYLTRIDRPDILWSAKKLCSNSNAKDKSLLQTLSSFDCLHSAHEWLPTIWSCGKCDSVLSIIFFQDSDFTDDLEGSKSTSGGIICVFGSRIFVSISWMCKKQTSVSHSSTESEVVALDADLRMDGIPALDLWDAEIEVLHSSNTSIMQVRDYRKER